MGSRRLPKLGTVLCLTLSLTTFTAETRAGDVTPASFSIGLLPYSMKPATGFLDSFEGTGTSISITAAPFPSWQEAIELNAANQGGASVVAIQYRYYVSGVVQYAPLRSGTELTLKHSGWYFEVGPALYSLSTGTTTQRNTNTGLGMVATVGWEFPVFGKFFFAPGINYLNSMGGVGYSAIYTRLLLGMPINF